MISKKVWFYWEGKKYPYIEYCLKTIQQRTGIELHLITPENVKEYIKDGIDLNARWHQLSWIAQKIDCLRVALLYKFGGCWLDADSVILKDMNSLFDQYQDQDTVCMRWKRTGRILNGYFFAQQNSQFLKHCLDWVNNKLAKNFKHHYPDHGGVLFGECLFGEIHQKFPSYVKFIEPEIFLPIQFPFEKRIWWQTCPIENYLKPNTVAIGLNHSQYDERLKQRSMKEHLEGNDLFSNIFNYSEKIGKIL